MKWNLFLDDERDPPSSGSWTVARTSFQAELHTRVQGIPFFMSLDHDLGSKHDTGMRYLIWLESYMHHDGLKFPLGFNFYIHSQNPIGKKNMESYLNQMLRIYGSG
jgi:hypothetical protein